MQTLFGILGDIVDALRDLFRKWRPFQRLVSLLLLLAVTLVCIYWRETWRTLVFAVDLLDAARSPGRPPISSQVSPGLGDLERKLAGSLCHEAETCLAMAAPKTRWERERCQAWNLAQIAVALRDLPNEMCQTPVATASFEQYLSSRTTRTAKGGEGWPEVDGGNCDPAHVVVSAWAVYALAKQGRPASAARIEFLLENIDPARPGGWPLFAGGDAEHTSVYATVWAALALNEQLAPQVRPAQPPELGRRMEAARDQAIDWIVANNVDGQACRWASYPNVPKANTAANVSLHNSALVIHLLERVRPGRYAAVEQCWLGQLPVDRPPATTREMYGGWVPSSAGITKDTVYGLALPWMIVATVDSYPAGSVVQRARAVRFLKQVAAANNEIEREILPLNWISAETLIALRHLDGGLQSP